MHFKIIKIYFTLSALSYLSTCMHYLCSTNSMPRNQVSRFLYSSSTAKVLRLLCIYYIPNQSCYRRACITCKHTVHLFNLSLAQFDNIAVFSILLHIYIALISIALHTHTHTHKYMYMLYLYVLIFLRAL